MYTAPITFRNVDDAENSFIKHGRRYTQILAKFAETAAFWQTYAGQSTRNAISVEAINAAGTGFFGSVLGQPFAANITPVLTRDGIASKLTVTKQGIDNRTIVCATYLFSMQTDILLENGQVLMEKDHDYLEYLWLCHLAEAVIAEVNC